MVLAALFLAAGLLGGPGDGSRPPAAVERTAAPSAAVAEAETARLNAWFDARNEEALASSPMARTSVGDKRDYDKIDDMSEAA